MPRFRFVILLTSLHFFTGYAFLSAVSMDGSPVKLFTRGSAPMMVCTTVQRHSGGGPFTPTLALQSVLKLSVAGALSIVLLNYSLRLNSVGTYQILKVRLSAAVERGRTSLHCVKDVYLLRLRV